MKRLASISILSIVLLILTGVLPRAAESSGDVWLKVTTKNFTLVGNASEKEIRKVGAKLEQFRSAVSLVFDFRHKRFSPPVTVIVFKDHSSYEPYKPLYQGKPAVVSGYLHSSRDAAYITLTADWQRSNPDHIIFHEYVHFLTGGNSRSLPVWMSEGLAEYYSTFDVAGNGKQVVIGGAITTHSQLLRREQILPLQTLFEVDYESPYYQETDKKSIFYAQAWAMVHFLMAGKGGLRQAQFRRYMEALASGRFAGSGEAGVKQFFQIDLTTLDFEFRQYIRRNAYPTQSMAFERRIESDERMIVAPLSLEESQVYLGDLLCRLDRYDESEQMLERVLAQKPELIAAHTSLGLLRIRQKRFAEARSHLQHAIDANTTNYMAYYSYAFAYQQEQVDSTGYVTGFWPGTVKAMRALLYRAREIEPDFPDTYKALAFINLVQKENLDEALKLLKRALELEPGRDDFIYTLAQVYSRLDDFAAARQTAESLIRDAANPGMRDRAKYLLEAIDKREEDLARAKEEEARRLRERNTSGGSEDDPTRPPGKRFSGEQVRGLLTRVECANDYITLTVVSGARVFRFQAEPSKLIFVRHTMNIPNEITCGTMSPARQVIVTYRPNSAIKLKFDGEPVGVEFIKADTN
ncbi:MAG: tetratricopeptide repeat protein [Blastocatellales bacterium]